MSGVSRFGGQSVYYRRDDRRGVRVVGIRLATHCGERVAVAPSFAIGGYSRGRGKDLGNPAVIGRFGLDVEYRFDDDLRIGLAYHHMSNGKVLGQSTNPGTEIVGLTLSTAIR